MAGAASWLWGIALAALVLLSPSIAHGAEVVPPGREAEVLALVQRALATQGEEPTYDVRIDHGVLRVVIARPEKAELVVYYEDSVDGELAPGVLLRCGSAPCSEQERARWKGLAEALAAERDRARDTIWVNVEPAQDSDAPSYVVSTLGSRPLWIGICLFGLSWLMFYASRCLREQAWRERRWEFGLCAGLCVASAAVALLGTAHLPIHEHNSYLARADCAWMLDCTRDPAGPGWVPGFFRAYGPLLHAFPYSVVNHCRFTLVLGLIAALLARHWLVRLLTERGWSAAHARRAGLLALGVMCLNPLWIRVAVGGTTWSYVLVCLFGAGLAMLESQRGSTAARFAAGAAATCFLTLAVNSNLVMLTALPLLWLGPAMQRKGPRWWLPSAWQVAAGMACLVLSLEALSIFRGALLKNAQTQAHLTSYHVFFDWRFLPPTLGLLLLLGIAVAARRRSPLWALGYVMLATQPTLSSYAGPVLGPDYPVSLLNAFLGQSLAALFVGVGVAWLLSKAAERGRTRAAVAVLAGAVLLPLPFAREGWRFLRGSRVAERELAAISLALPKLPRHQQLVVPTRIQPMLGDAKPAGDRLELQFPAGEYLATERRIGRNPPPPMTLEAMKRSDTPELGAPGTLVYVGASQRSFFPEEERENLVPVDLRRSELEALYARFDLIPVATFELTAEQHEAIPWRLGAGRVAKLELGFYWLKPKAR
ncbi:MAG: hypothetical protein R3B07_16020 [Polyangiaceae bacterium]